MPKWRTRTIILVSIGAAATLAACAPEPEYRRNGYATRADCLKDYPPEHCPGGAGAGGYFYGPWFFADRRRAPMGDPGPGATAAATGRSAVAQPDATATRRGGFGSTARAYSSPRGG